MSTNKAVKPRSEKPQAASIHHYQPVQPTAPKEEDLTAKQKANKRKAEKQKMVKEVERELQVRRWVSVGVGLKQNGAAREKRAGGLDTRRCAFLGVDRRENGVVCVCCGLTRSTSCCTFCRHQTRSAQADS